LKCFPEVLVCAWRITRIEDFYMVYVRCSYLFSYWKVSRTGELRESGFLGCDTLQSFRQITYVLSKVSSLGEMLTIHEIGTGSDPSVIRLGGGDSTYFIKIVNCE
jgi:hypothetical protein